jgi:hypothetical protein
LALACAVLLCGTAQWAIAQSAEDELRLQTDVDVEEPVPPPPPLAITIGDDQEPVLPRRATRADPYAPQGIRSGAFVLYPSLEIGSVLASNPRNATSDASADVGLRLRPELRIESDWTRHSFTADTSLNVTRYVDNDDLTSVAGNIDARLRLDVRRSTTAEVAVNYTATSTGLESSELPATATGSRLDHEMGLQTGVTHDFGGLEGELRLGLERNLFGNVELSGGGEEDNSDRDYTELTVAARASAKTGAVLQPFAELVYDPRFYDKATDRNGLKRDSQGLRFSLGLGIDDDPVWSGEIAATLALRDYTDESLNTVVAPGFTGNLTWRPTDLTQFEFNAGATLSETVDAGVSATRNWTFGVNGRHALRENVSLRAGLSAEFERAAGETDITTVGSLGIDWTLNPFVVLSAGYEGTFFNTPGSGGDYSDHRLITSIILRR